MATDDRKLILRIDFLWDAFRFHRCGRVYRVTGSPFVLPPVCESLRLLTFGENCDPSPARPVINHASAYVKLPSLRFHTENDSIIL